MLVMDKAKILHEAQADLQRHVWGTYIDKGVSIALGGDGIVTPGCEACHKRINTNSQYLRHLAEDVLPNFGERRLAVRTRFSCVSSFSPLVVASQPRGFL